MGLGKKTDWSFIVMFYSLVLFFLIEAVTGIARSLPLVSEVMTVPAKTALRPGFNTVTLATEHGALTWSGEADESTALAYVLAHPNARLRLVLEPDTK